MNWAIVSDEITAVGWRLAGAQVFIADEHSVRERLAAAGRVADLVLITADLAAHLPDTPLEDALREEKPLIVMIGGLQSGREPPDLEHEVKHVLGVGI